MIKNNIRCEWIPHKIIIYFQIELETALFAKLGPFLVYCTNKNFIYDMGCFLSYN